MERRRRGEDTWHVMEALQVMSLLLLKMLVQVFVLLLLKVSLLKVLSLSSPRLRTQTTMPSTSACSAH